MTTQETPWRVEQVAALPGWTSGVAVASSGRVFVSAPQSDQPARMPTVAEIVDGAARPFPVDVADTFTSVQGLRAGPDNTLYALETGVRALSGCDTAKAALRVIDVESAQVVRSYHLPSEVALPSTYLKRSHPRHRQRPRISHRRRRPGTPRPDRDRPGHRRDAPALPRPPHLPHHHLTGRAHHGRRPTTGHPRRPGHSQPVAVGATGITLAEHGRTLYWNRADELFSVVIDDLEQLTGSSLERTITTWPVRAFAPDGLDQDADGNLLLTDIADSGVQRLDPETGIYTAVATNREISWPDGVAVAPDGTIYVTSSQLHRGPMFNATDQRRPPFGVFHLSPHT